MVAEAVGGVLMGWCLCPVLERGQLLCRRLRHGRGAVRELQSRRLQQQEGSAPERGCWLGGIWAQGTLWELLGYRETPATA